MTSDLIQVTATTSDTREANRETVRRLVEEGWSKGDLDALDDILAPSVVIHGQHEHMADHPAYGPNSARDEIVLYRGAFPDLNLHVATSVAEGEWVMMAWEGVGTHDGPLLGLPPTGRTVRMAGVYLARVQDGRITEARHTPDTLGINQQLGAIPDKGNDAETSYIALIRAARTWSVGIERRFEHLTMGREPDRTAAPGVAMTSDRTGPDLVRRLVDDVANGRHYDALDDLLHPERIVQENVSSPVLGNPTLAAGRHATLVNAAPDLHVAIDGLVSEGDLVGYGWLATGTHTGPLGGIAATGRSFVFMGSTISRVVDGRIGDTVHRYDAAALLEQIGRLPPASGTLEIFG